MATPSAIVLRVPATLRYRDLAVRTVTAACHLIGADDGEVKTRDIASLDLQRAFDAQFISAFSEIFNNIAIHSYERSGDGEVILTLRPGTDHLELEIRDEGKAFDIESVPAPELDALPEGGMGIHIARACLDSLDYQAGPPNVWRLSKTFSKDGKR